MSRAGVLAVTILAAACLGGLAIVSTLGGHSTAPAPPRMLSVATSIAPRPAFFGDLVTARAEVIVDRRRVDPATVRIDTDFAPYELVGAPRESRSDSGPSTSLGFRLTLSCLSEACLPGREATGVPLPPFRVHAAVRAGGATVVSAPWPRVEVAPRVEAGALTRDPPPWHLQLAPPPVSYRVAPGLLAGALTAAAAALALAAAALVGWELRRRRRLVLERVRARSALERALALAREAATRDPDDRRRALALLARVLAVRPDGGRELAPAAARLAWAHAEPTPAGVAALADEVERSVRPR